MIKPIYVTQPSLPPLEEFSKYLQQIWETGLMTHNGPLLQRLERELSAYENVPDTVCVASGTSAVQLAIRALDLEGENITTPFTFVATANIIAWERCTPVFVDIDPDTWNIDPEKIEEAITDKTCAILPVHVFSAPCDVARIQQIACKHSLKVIYDAAHALCVQVGGKSIMSYGDVSCTSFHATKLFNTCEGGACFMTEEDVAARIRRMRFFGFDEQKKIVDSGMNAKMTEITAGLGLANLKYIDEVRVKRREKYEIYQSLLESRDYITFQKFNSEEYNFSYMPILFDTEELLIHTLKKLESEGIYPRRYFYPSLHNVEIFKSAKCTVAESVSPRIICLPLYNTLENQDIERICRLL